jgi:PAS domain S-box-containing protein
MTRVKIGQKLLLLLLAISLGPLLIVGVILVVNAQNQLKKEAIVQQQLAASKAADSVDNFLATKTDVLIFQSQTSALREFDIPNAQLNLAAMVKQDRDIEHVALLDKTGMEKVVLNSNGLVSQHNNDSQSDAFKSTTFLAGKEYVSPVSYDSQNQPHVTIAVPLIRFTTQQDLTHLSTAEFGQYRSPDDILGVLVVDFDLSDLWQSVLSTKVGDKGYAYVVDDKGNLIAYPDSAFLAKHHSLTGVHEIQDFLQNNPDVHVSTSERGQQVLASYQPITRTNWAVIAEEPTSSVFASVYSFYRLGAGILLAVAVIAVATSLLFRRQLLIPIQLIASGAMRIGRGDLQFKIPVRSDDELGDLAHSFNSMGGSLQALVHGLQQKNQTLTLERRRLASILESISDGVIAINKAQEIIGVNAPAAKLVGKTNEQLMGGNLLKNFVLMRDDQPFEPRFDKPGVYRYDDILLPQGEHLSYLELIVTVLQEQMGEIAAIITVHDLTEGRELETMKLDFVAIAAHELRTPLTVVRGYLDLINSSPEISKLTVMNIEYLERALVGVSQLSSLINNILNVSRIERGTMSVAFVKLDIAALLSQLVREEMVGATLKEQRLRYEGPLNKVFVIADESAISEVVNNLLTNAIKYTPDHGHITVRLKTTGGFVRIEVEDDGRGIPDSARPHLFTKFYRVESSMTSGNRGTGLGLFISKSIIELHHGEIGVVSAPGKGSTFFFTLPVHDESKQSQLNAQPKELKGIHGWFPKRTDR